MGADLAVHRMDRLLRVNDEAMIEVRMGDMDAIIKAKSIQEEIFDNIFFALNVDDIKAITARFNALSHLIGVGQRMRANNPTMQPPRLSEMINHLVMTNRILHIHLSRLKITFAFDEKLSYDKKLANALDVTEEDMEKHG